jgi:hypothetical protein
MGSHMRAQHLHGLEALGKRAVARAQVTGLACPSR